MVSRSCLLLFENFGIILDRFFRLRFSHHKEPGECLIENDAQMKPEEDGETRKTIKV
jgi:hypothetical protein